MAKWELFDFVTDTTVELEINPESADIGGIERSLSEVGSTAPDGQRILFEGKRAPRTMSFSGVGVSQEHYEMLDQWAEKNYQIRLTDDLDRVFWIYITGFSPTRRKTSAGGLAGESITTNHWIFDYTLEATVLDWSS